MKIISVKSLGVQQTYAPEMRSEQHNYMTNSSSSVHANSHGVSYCLVAHRCLWLKANFAPEWWASVMSLCHPDKLVRYMGMARVEPWIPTDITYSGHFKGNGNNPKSVEFGTVNIHNLNKNFTVTGDVVNQGLVGIKGLGKKGSLVLVGKGDYSTIEEFMVSSPARSKKIVMERFIKLGAFSILAGHSNAKALWMWYQYNHCKSSNVSALKKEIYQKLLLLSGWTDKTIADEVKRQVSEFRKQYPKRTKIPTKIVNWKPILSTTRSAFEKLYPDNFTAEEKLDFQKLYLGYWIDSPFGMYECSGTNTIENARTKAIDKESIIVDGIIVDVVDSVTKTSKPYLRLFITDGLQKALIFVWTDELTDRNLNNIGIGVGVTMAVTYDKKRGMFSLARRSSIHKLLRKDRNKTNLLIDIEVDQ